MSQPSNSAVRGSPTSSAASTASTPAAATGDFVVNLCASTTPMALAKPSAPELARYTFFVSRRREEGRERFRLHMGYFATRDEAEQMLQLVRDLYPAAWVGETPGRKLAPTTARSSNTSSAPVTPANVTGRAGPLAAQSVVEIPSVPVAPSRAAASTPPPPAKSTRAAPAPAPSPALALSPASASASASASAPAAVVAPATAPAAAPVLGAIVASAPVAPSRAAAPRAAVPPASNVREVIAALGPEAAEPTVSMPQLRVRAPVSEAPPHLPAAPARAAQPAAAATAALLLATRPAATAVSPATAPAPALGPTPTPIPTSMPASVSAALPPTRSTSPGADMTDTQVLRVLEGRAAAAQARDGAAAAAGSASQAGRDIALLSPQDTQTWRDIKEQIKRDAVVHFAVQLSWSVTPIDLGRVPSLAIFNAYTLYKIEGNREGRKWYGLRLGFFSDAVSAKQVAHYVRSEFAQVAVVPVGISEREQAKQIGAIALPAAPAAVRAATDSEHEFKLIDDEPKLPPSAVASAMDELPETPVQQARAKTTTASSSTRAPAATTRRPTRPRGAPQSLEETLEILGASQLSIDSGRGERVVIDGRARRVDAPTSTFTKLLDRLGEKLRK